MNFLKRFIAAVCTVCCFNVASAVDANADPLGSINRVTFYLNHMAFSLYVKPATKVYGILPPPVIGSVHNFIQNIRTVPYTANNILQGDVITASKSALRFVINTTLGVFGLFDVADELGLPEKISTFGDTMYCWGWKESSYLVVPLVGPSTIRDTFGLLADYFMTPSAYFKPEYWNPYYVTVLVNTNYRAKSVLDLVSIAGVNDYDFVRSSYLQHRQFELTGQVPDTEGLTDMLGEPPD